MITALLASMLFLLSPWTLLQTPVTEDEPESRTTVAYFKSQRPLSPELETALSTEEGTAANYDVVIQFTREPTSEEKALMDALGVKMRSRFRVLCGGGADAPGAALQELANKEFIGHIELNHNMIQDMDMSLQVVNATNAWDRWVIRNDQYVGRIDGTGVTVCIVDTGIDASHPDLDYGTKTLFNLHDTGNGRFVEVENSDIYVGHGTHVAGTVAGNGDASAGTRSGVAPGANLIGLSVSIPEQSKDPTIESYISGLEWVYENSRPGSNTYNIRCATNSWHSTVGEYDPEMALSVITEKLAFDNNVVTTWSAGNDGRDDPQGSGITTSQQGNVPVAIEVAAYEHDGSAVTDFSSRGQVGLNHTYPDVGAPGRSIWSCAARRTLISTGSYVGGNDNPYYLAISGTSMSTPHIAGTVALLWQAAPSMRVSYVHDDYNGDDASWWSNPRTRVHEVELILKASAKYLEPTEEHGVLVGNVSTLPGWMGLNTDYVQGYGIVDVEKAVGIALALQELRNKYPEENITVEDAVKNYELIKRTRTVSQPTDTLTASWSGEYSRFQGRLGETLSTANQTRKIVIPPGASSVHATLTYSALNLDDLSATDVSLRVDIGDDGTWDLAESFNGLSSGTKEYDIDATGNDGKVWVFDITGQGVKVQNPLERNYVELRCEYDISLQVTMVPGSQVNITRTAPIYLNLDLGLESATADSSPMNKTENVYDLSRVIYEPAPPPAPKPKKTNYLLPVLVVCAIVILASVIAYGLYRRRKK